MARICHPLHFWRFDHRCNRPYRKILWPKCRRTISSLPRHLSCQFVAGRYTYEEKEAASRPQRNQSRPRRSCTRRQRERDWNIGARCFCVGRRALAPHLVMENSTDRPCDLVFGICIRVEVAKSHQARINDSVSVETVTAVIVQGCTRSRLSGRIRQSAN